jgi:RsiW-degrading membrane proteinase PrsW (M82 family)
MCFVWENVVTPLLWFTLTAVLISLLTGAWWMGKEEHKPYVLPLALASVLPSAVILFFVYAWNNRASAPMALVVGCYIWGILACAPVALLESLFTILYFSDNKAPAAASKYSATMAVGECLGLAAISSYLVAALCEEGFKFLFVTWRADDSSSGRFLTTYGIIVLAMATSLGFATLENATYVLAPHTRVSDAFQTALWRSLLSVPLHVVCGTLCGWAIARRTRASPSSPLAPRSAGKSVPLWLAFGAPFLIHGTFDFVLEVTPAITPFLSKDQVQMSTNISIITAALIVIISGLVALWLVSDMHMISKDEVAREEASEWPSIDSIEEGAGCVSGREGYEDEPVWK